MFDLRPRHRGSSENRSARRRAHRDRMVQLAELKDTYPYASWYTVSCTYDGRWCAAPVWTIREELWAESPEQLRRHMDAAIFALREAGITLPPVGETWPSPSLMDAAGPANPLGGYGTPAQSAEGREAPGASAGGVPMRLGAGSGISPLSGPAPSRDP